MKKRAEIIVYGRVQRVSFRVSAFEKAKQVGVVGYVENLSDGTVHIETEGKPEQLEIFIDWCHIGPRFAEVDRVDVKYSVELKNFTKFEVVNKGFPDTSEDRTTIDNNPNSTSKPFNNGV